MRAVRIHEFGGPEKVHVEEVPTPEPRPGEVLVRVMAAALNPIDWKIREHLFQLPVPLTLGHDFAGRIVELGPGTSESVPDTLPSLGVGSEVLGQIRGSFAEYVAVPVKSLVLKPASLDFVTAASLPMPSLTAWQAVIDTAHARAGLRFLVHGAGGSVGSFAAQLARLQGAWCAVTASRPSFPWLREIAANQIVDYREQRFEDVVHDIDVVIDPLGGEIQERSLGVMKPGALLINLVGKLDRAAAAAAHVRAMMMIMRYDAVELREIVGLVERGLLKPHVTQVLSLDEALTAMELNRQGLSHGKIVLKVA